MDHRDHVALIRGGVPDSGGTWADIGAGEGAFTLALADVLGPSARIFAVDRDAGALRANAEAMARRFAATQLTTLVADLEGPLDLPMLDGLVVANVLHFVPRARHVAAIRSLAAYLRPDAPFIVVEYDAERGNPWVPHPFSMRGWERLAAEAGLEGTTEIGRVPSRFLGAIYAAVSRRPSAVTSRSTSPESL
jgi:SAM-dependent methyltransferase